MIEQKEGKKVYICECGREFDNPQAFNGHKSNCKIHLSACNKQDMLELRRKAISNSMKKFAEKKALDLKLKKELELILWVEEKHVCETCGKVMTEKYGSGRFCSRSCANTKKHTEETKHKISVSLAGRIQDPTCQQSQSYLIRQQAYYDAPNYCKICGEVLPYIRRNNKTCGSASCLHKIQQVIITAHGGNLNNKYFGSLKKGSYRGIW